jgi:hypothetical protein
VNRRTFLAALVTAPVVPLQDTAGVGGFLPDRLWFGGALHSNVAMKITMSSFYGKFSSRAPYIYTTAESSLSEHTRRRIELGRRRFCST